MGVHPAAAEGFGTEETVAAYERGRPEYPAEAVAWLVGEAGIGPGRRVLDLAAGSGKLTRRLVPTGADVVAVEPVAAMRDRLAASLPGVEVLDGTAEALPLPDQSVDAATVGQGFHWFDAEAALAELHRVLRPGGALALVWNVRQEESDWERRLGAILRRLQGGTPSYRDRAWERPFAATSLFADRRERRFPHAQVLAPEGVVDRVTSVSYVARLPDGERAAVVDEVRRLVAGHPDGLVLSYRTDAYCWRRVP